MLFLSITQNEISLNCPLISNSRYFILFSVANGNAFWSHKQYGVLSNRESGSPNP